MALYSRLAGAIVVVSFLAVAACARNPDAALRQHLGAGDRYVAAGKISEAIIEYRSAVAQNPTSGEARAKLGDAYLKAQDDVKAYGEIIRAADLLPNDAPLQLKAATLLLLASKFEDARTRAERVIERDPKSVAAHLVLANALVGAKDVDTAVRQMEEAISLDPEHGATYTALGTIQLEHGRAQAAEEAFKKAVDLDPKSVPARLSLVDLYLATGRPRDADAILAETLAVAPDNVTANRAMAAFCLLTNRTADAEQYLKKVAKLTDAPAAALALADYYVAQGKESAAVAVLQPLRTDPRASAEATVRLAGLDNRHGRVGDALARLDGVLVHDSANLNALMLKAKLLLSQGKADDALKAADAAVAGHADSTTAFFLLARIHEIRREAADALKAYEEAVRLNPRATPAKVAVARLRLAVGEIDPSVTAAEDALRAEPSALEPKLLLVQALLTRRDVKRAETELVPLLKQYPQSATVQARMAVLRTLQANDGEARKFIDRAAALAPDSFEVLGAQTTVDLSAKRYDAARRRIEDRLQRGTPAPPLLMLAARMYATTGEAARAEQMLLRTVKADANYLEAYQALGQIYAAQHRLPEARKQFQTLVERDPSAPATLTMLAMIEQMQGDTKSARVHYEQVLQTDAHAGVAGNNLAWIYATESDKLDEALALARMAVGRLPDNADVSDTLGYIYYRKNMQDLAIETLQKAVERDDRNPLYHCHLGLAYAKAGHSNDAREHLTTALKINPAFEGAAEAKRVLATLW